MKQSAQQLRDIVGNYTPLLNGLDRAAMLVRPAPGKWSQQEILGHLIDSAQSNIRRFIIGQYEHEPHIVYDQEKWVQLSAYNEQDPLAVIRLWILLNLHLATILEKMPPEFYSNKVKTQELHSLEWLAADYVKHLLHHLNHLLGLEPVPYP